MVARSTAPTKYAGAAPKSALTEEDIARLRSKMPDDPVRLPPRHLACEACGVAHNGPVILSIPAGLGGRLTAEFTRCPDCQRLAAGDERTRNTLYALAVIGQSPPEDPAPLVPWLHALGGGVSWLVPEAPNRGWCSPHPWAHVTIRQRAGIREAFTLAMRSRIRVGAPALAIKPPHGGACLFCGVGSLPMTPLDVVRRGGRENAAHSIWRRVLTRPTALGGSGPDLVDGFLCTACSEATDRTGAVGVRARARAFEQHARSNGIPVPAGLDDYDNIVLPGWGALGSSRPNPKPWAHIEVVQPDEDDA